MIERHAGLYAELMACDVKSAITGNSIPDPQRL
jgi:hypothetical protein